MGRGASSLLSEGRVGSFKPWIGRSVAPSSSNPRSIATWAHSQARPGLGAARHRHVTARCCWVAGVRVCRRGLTSRSCSTAGCVCPQRAASIPGERVQDDAAGLGERANVGLHKSECRRTSASSVRRHARPPRRHPSKCSAGTTPERAIPVTISRPLPRLPHGEALYARARPRASITGFSWAYPSARRRVDTAGSIARVGGVTTGRFAVCRCIRSGGHDAHVVRRRADWNATALRRNRALRLHRCRGWRGWRRNALDTHRPM